jgi:hypothetical protein
MSEASQPQIEAAAVGLIARGEANQQKPAFPFLRKTYGLSPVQAVAAIRRANELRSAK